MPLLLNDVLLFAKTCLFCQWNSFSCYQFHNLAEIGITLALPNEKAHTFLRAQKYFSTKSLPYFQLSHYKNASLL